MYADCDTVLADDGHDDGVVSHGICMPCTARFLRDSGNEEGAERVELQLEADPNYDMLTDPFFKE